MSNRESKLCDWCKDKLALTRSGRYMLCNECHGKERGEFGIVGGSAVMIGKGSLPRAVQEADRQMSEQEKQ